jgi:hypothetical protein
LLQHPLAPHRAFPAFLGHATAIPSGMVRHEAFIEKNWREMGLAHVVLWRTRGDGFADFAIFLVDCWCLGVKDVIWEERVPLAVCENLIHSQLPEDFREHIHPACAKKLVEGAIAYAERLGFSPHRDYRKARRLLSGLDVSLCPAEYEFGRSGRPCFVPGIDDDDTRIQRVLTILEARLGREGFDYEPPADDDLPAFRTELRALLNHEPETVPRFYQISGMIAGLHIAPRPTAPEKLFEFIRLSGSRAWDRPEDRQTLLNLLLQYWVYCGKRITDSLSPDAHTGISPLDIYEDEFGDIEDGSDENADGDDADEDAKNADDEQYRAMAMTAAVLEWAIGFHRTTTEWPEAWGDALTRPDLAPHWEIVRLWSDMTTTTGNFARIEKAALQTPPRTIAQSVLEIARALRRPPA